jgi:hypothetical protein
MDSRIFWWSLYLTPVVWSVFAFMKILQFYTLDFLICVIAMTLSYSNVIGYRQCEKDARKRMDVDIVGGVFSSFVGNRFFGS